MFEIIYDLSLGIPGFTVCPEECIDKDIRQIVKNHLQLHFIESGSFEFYLVHNGKKLESDVSEGLVHVIPCLPGGKGGFGSMLRAIGAQIEKTTNREACRDLSGRRLRDINEEKRLKKWIAEQAEREREAAERKKKKYSKMCAEPKHEFSDPDYDKARSELIDKVNDAVEEGLKTAMANPSVSESSSEKADPKNRKRKNIKGALWVDELDELDDEDDEDDEDNEDGENGEKSEKSEESEEETPKKKIKLGE